jgi:NAD(P)H-dependent flavin oxidoreductase YrpB (nitropropane dioxygenase family)
MLTHDDRTVRDARSLVPAITESGVRYAGAKDVGLPADELRALFDDLRATGCTTFLEVVSETPEAMVRSARAALAVRPDYLIGGTEIAATTAVLAGSGIRYFPYVGRIVGHPCLLRGTIAEIVADGARAEAAGVDGINLLAYRYDGDVERLVERLLAAVSVPVLCAGSIDSETRIAAMRRLGAWAFTVGTAALDGAFVPDRPLVDQLRRILELAGSAASD